MTVPDIDVTEYRDDYRIIAAIAEYVCPKTQGIYTFQGKDREEAERLARLDMIKRYGVDVVLKTEGRP
jgi:hypothetical protein